MSAEQVPLGKRDYYGLLGVTFESTEAQIRAAYLRLALKWHPDKHPDDEAAKEFFLQISEAYHVLSDPLLREEFDKATEFDVEHMALKDYLHRFTTLILTVNGLGSVAGWGEEAAPVDPLLLSFHAAPVAETSPR